MKLEILTQMFVLFASPIQKIRSIDNSLCRTCSATGYTTEPGCFLKRKKRHRFRKPIKVATQDKCRLACNKHSSCEGYVYNSTIKKCFLKKKIAQAVKKCDKTASVALLSRQCKHINECAQSRRRYTNCEATYHFYKDLNGGHISLTRINQTAWRAFHVMKSQVPGCNSLHYYQWLITPYSSGLKFGTYVWGFYERIDSIRITSKDIWLKDKVTVNDLRKISTQPSLCPNGGQDRWLSSQYWKKVP